MSSAHSSLVAVLRDRLRAGSTVALGDGVGAVGPPAGAALSEVAHELDGIRLVLGWLPAPLDGLDVDAFSEIVLLMPGWGARSILQSPAARFLPTRLTGIAALLEGPLRPDLLVTRLTRRSTGLHFTTEVSWQQGLLDAGVPVCAVVDPTAPAGCLQPVDAATVTVACEVVDGPAALPAKEPEPLHDALSEQVLRWLPAGARLQYGPGQLGTALLNRTRVPLAIDTGLLTDAVLSLSERGLLRGTPSATYLLGTPALYQWADGRGVLGGIGHTHDISRLAQGDPFIAVNTALEIDRYGQVNVEGFGDKIFGGIGGHPDYCAAGRMSRAGLSIIAVPTTTAGRSPFVEHLSRPASTPAYDVDVIVTESGSADLRAADWNQRQKIIDRLFRN